MTIHEIKMPISTGRRNDALESQKVFPNIQSYNPYSYWIYLPLVGCFDYINESIV